MKVLVTGAGGYLGRGITSQLIDMGVEVIATDISVKGIDNRAKCIQGDIFALDDPYGYFDCPDSVLHLAWRNGFVHNADSHLNDLPLHFAFLKKLIDSGICRVSVMGTMHEVGFHEGPIKADTPCFPMNAYGISKNALRQLLFSFARTKEVELQWLRAFYIVNNDPAGSSVFSKVAKAASLGEKTFPLNSGMNQYDFLDYGLFCRYVASTVVKDQADGIINICSGFPQRLSDRMNRFILENQFNIQLDYGAYPDRPYDSKAIWGDSAYLEQIMGSEFKRWCS